MAYTSAMALGSPTGMPNFGPGSGSAATPNKPPDVQWIQGAGYTPGQAAPGPSVSPQEYQSQSQPSAAPSPGNQMQSLYNNLMNQYRPQQDALAANTSLTQNMAGMRDSYYQNQMGFANKGYQNDLGRLGSNRAMNQLDINAAGQNIPLLDQIMGLTRQSQGLNWQDLASQKGQINLDQTQANQKANSAAVSGGFGLAPGVQTGIAQTNQGAMYARERATTGATQQDIGYQKSLIQADMQKNLDKTGLAKLQEKAKQFGMDESDLYTNLQKSLAGLGLDRFTNANDLLKMANSTNQQQSALGEEILTQLMQQAQQQGIGANDIQSFTDSLKPKLDYYDPKNDDWLM